MAGSIAGTLIRGDLKPKVPTFNKIDAGVEQQKAIRENLEALPGAENLASKTNAFNIEQINKMLEASVPDYANISKNVSENLKSLTSGEIPQDVQNMLQMSAAGKALSGGYAGTGMSHNLQARDFGLTSLDLIQKGINSATQWLGQMDAIYKPGMMNVTSMFLTPEQQIAHDVSERDKAWDVKWLKSQIDAQPSALQNAFAGLFDNIEQLGRSFLSSYAGGMSGGMGGGGGGAAAGGAAAGSYAGAAGF